MTYVNLNSNVCISAFFNGENLDEDKSLAICFTNWELLPDRPPETTPAGSERNFKGFFVIFVRMLIVLFD